MSKKKRVRPHNYYFIHGKTPEGIYRDYAIGECLPTTALVKECCVTNNIAYGYLAYLEMTGAEILPQRRYQAVVTQQLVNGYPVMLMKKRVTTWVNS